MDRLEEIKNATNIKNFDDSEGNWLISEVESLRRKLGADKTTTKYKQPLDIRIWINGFEGFAEALSEASDAVKRFSEVVLEAKKRLPLK